MFEIFKKMNFFNRTREKLGRQRTVDDSIEKALKSVKSDYNIVPSMEIKAWKAYLIIMFIAGFFAGSYLGNIYVRLFWIRRPGIHNVFQEPVRNFR